MVDDSIHEVVRFLRKENVRLKRENAELRHELEEVRSVLAALQGLQEVSASLNVRTDVLFLMQRILESALTSIRAQDGSLLLVDEETEELVFVVAHGALANTLVGFRIPRGQGIAGWVAANKEAAMVQNVHRDPRFSPQVDQTFDFRTNSLLCVPIVYGRSVLGVIQALNKEEGEPFTDADLTLLGVVAQLAATAMRNMSRIIEKEEAGE